jgi:hypothetical protein
MAMNAMLKLLKKKAELDDETAASASASDYDQASEEASASDEPDEDEASEDMPPPKGKKGKNLKNRFSRWAASDE